MKLQRLINVLCGIRLPRNLQELEEHGYKITRKNPFSKDWQFYENETHIAHYNVTDDKVVSWREKNEGSNLL